METAMLQFMVWDFEGECGRSCSAAAQMCSVAAGDQLPLVSLHSGVIHQQDLQARLESPSLWNATCCCTTNASSTANLESLSCSGSGDDNDDGSPPPRQAAPDFRQHPAVSLTALRRRWPWCWLLKQRLRPLHPFQSIFIYLFAFLVGPAKWVIFYVVCIQWPQEKRRKIRTAKHNLTLRNSLLGKQNKTCLPRIGGKLK